MPRKKKVQPTSAPKEPREVAPLPEWFQAPEKISQKTGLRRVHGFTDRLENFAQAIRDGDFSIPPWQRGSVWTLEQKISLLDSIMKGIPFGTITLWVPAHEEKVDLRAFPSCTLGTRPAVVLDGLQRMTTILEASRGELGLYWDGNSWSPNHKGFLQEDTGFHWQFDFFLSIQEFFGDEILRLVIDEHGKIKDTLVTMTVLEEYTIEEMVETYRRMATEGSPHSLEDLACMEIFLQQRKG